MEFLDLSDPGAHAVIINFPGRPPSVEHEARSHVGFEGKYEVVGNAVRQQGISFIGCQQVHENTQIISHTESCLQKLADKIRGKAIILVGTSAGAGGILACPLARSMATGMILLNPNLYNVGKKQAEWGIQLFKGWIDLYHGFNDFETHARCSERIVKENGDSQMCFDRIKGAHILTAAQTIIPIGASLERHNFIT